MPKIFGRRQQTQTQICVCVCVCVSMSQVDRIFFKKNKENIVCCKPGGDIVWSSIEGIVISIIGLLDGMPFTAS